MSLPLHVISGFLGSGKTTLLKRLLGHPSLENTFVLINEFGEVGLDHLLVGHLDEEMVLLQSGCVCCTLRGDLLNSLGELLEKQESGLLQNIDRVVLETTGLADPAPIASTLGAHGPLAGSFHLDGLVVTVDAMHGMEQLRDHHEARSQAALADRLVVTKLDLVPEERAAIFDELERLNPRAIIVNGQDELDPLELLSAGLIRPSDGHIDVIRWLAPGPKDRQLRLIGDHTHQHADVRSFVVTIDGEVKYERFALLLSVLTQTHGSRFLRIKALLSVPDEDGYLAVDAIRSFVHPPAVLPPVPIAPRVSIVVFIVQDLDDDDEAAIRKAIMSAAVKPSPENPKEAR